MKRVHGANDATVTQTVLVNGWSGPIPSPSDLARYDQIIPNGADRLVKQWEGETAHRHKMQLNGQWLPFYDDVVGRGVALIFALGCLFVIFKAIEMNAEWAAALLSGAMLVAGINALRSRKADDPPGRK